MKAIRVKEFGGPAEVMRLEEVPDPESPGPGDVVVRVRAGQV
jgi:NADPH:quinone reductase-like Zn-dependent oxidoreductase